MDVNTIKPNKENIIKGLHHNYNSKEGSNMKDGDCLNVE